jgi:ABC-type transport system involved in multi-copper enzyme maturation permease subunit
MNSCIAIAKNTFRETIRDKILYTIAFFGILLILSSKIMASISSGEEEKITLDFGLSMIHIFGILITLFIGTQMIAREMEGNMIMVLLSKPISRFDFLLGKFLGLSGILFLLIIIMGGIFFLLTPFSLSFLLVFAGMYISFLLLLALALFFSTFLSPLIAMFSSLLLWIIGNLTDDAYQFALHAREEISDIFFSIVWASYHFLPNFSTLNLKNDIVYSLSLTSLESTIIFLSSILYIIFLLTMAVFIFKKKEF